MSIASIALIALAIHVAGPEVDENNGATLQWFVQSRPEATWTVDSGVPGTYVVDGGGMLIHVERLSTTAGSYTLIHRDDVGAIRTIGAVVYDDPLPIGWRRGEEDAISIPAEEVLVAFRSVDVNVGSPPTGDNGAAEVGDPSPASSYEVIRQGNLITVADELSGEVVVLSH